MIWIVTRLSPQLYSFYLNTELLISISYIESKRPPEHSKPYAKAKININAEFGRR